MPDQKAKPVLVAVGHDPMDAALEYATEVAVREGCGLHLLHVLHHVAEGPEMVLVDIVDLEHAARGPAGRRRGAGPCTPPAGLPVTTQLVWGGPVSSIVDGVGGVPDGGPERRPLARVLRVVTRSTSSGVAAHAHVPVVSVPAAWARSRGPRPDRRGRRRHPRACRERPACGRRTRPGRAAPRCGCSTPGPTRAPTTTSSCRGSSTSSGPSGPSRTSARRSPALGDEAAGLTVVIEARHAFPGDALIQAARAADLLVIGRHDPLVPAGSHLGPVARAVLREATCPVLLADPRPRHHWGTPRQHADVV